MRARASRSSGEAVVEYALVRQEVVWKLSNASTCVQKVWKLSNASAPRRVWKSCRARPEGLEKLARPEGLLGWLIYCETSLGVADLAMLTIPVTLKSRRWKDISEQRPLPLF